MKWKCQDGRVVDIADMTTRQLKNAVAMLRRKGCVTKEEYFSLLAVVCSGDTPDGVAYATDGVLMTRSIHPALELMEMELARRPRRIET